MTTKIGSGATPLGGVASYKASGIPLIRSLNVYDDGFRAKDLAFIDDRQAAKLDNVIVEAGDVLLNITGASVARCCVAPREHLPARVNQHVSIIRPIKERLLPGFLHYLLISRDQKTRLLDTGEDGGSTRQAITKAQLQDFEIEFPPLDEQHRIVGLLEEALVELATIKANLERNVQNSRALFEGYLQSVFAANGHGWVSKRLGDFAEIQSGGTPAVSQKAFWGGPIPWYSSGELGTTFTTESERHITNSGLTNSNAKVFPKGSLLVGMYDTAALKMSILDRDGAFNQAVAGIKANSNIDVEFVLHAINANKPELLRERRGVRQKNLSLRKIKDIVIPIPTIAAQREIVSRLRTVTAATRDLEGLYRQKLASLNALKQSLLHEVLSGAF